MALKTKTLTITEDFSDEFLEFPIDSYWNDEYNLPFIYKGETSLDGSFGYFQNNGFASVIVFVIVAPSNSLGNTLNVKLAFRGDPETYIAYGFLEEDTGGYYFIPKEKDKVEFLNISLPLYEHNTLFAVIFNDYRESSLLQILNMSLSSIVEDDSNSYPIVTKLEASKLKISDEAGMNQSIITVRFDKDVTEYVARLNGSDYSTGTLVHQGLGVLANTDATVIIDWNELTREGENRINIYGKGIDGSWTIHQG